MLILEKLYNRISIVLLIHKKININLFIFYLFIIMVLLIQMIFVQYVYL